MSIHVSCYGWFFLMSKHYNEPYSKRYPVHPGLKHLKKRSPTAPQQQLPYRIIEQTTLSCSSPAYFNYLMT
jgi:hypothetical protein